MSNDVLVDIVIYDDPDSNEATIVGRPKLLGSSSRQMRHVIPYSFIEHAIMAMVATMQKVEGDYRLYIDNIVEAINGNETRYLFKPKSISYFVFHLPAQ